MNKSGNKSGLTHSDVIKSYYEGFVVNPASMAVGDTVGKIKVNNFSLLRPDYHLSDDANGRFKLDDGGNIKILDKSKDTAIDKEYIVK